MSFATVQDLAERLNVPFDPSDLRAIRALQDATALIQAWTHQTLEFVEDDEVALDGSGSRALVLPELPVLEVADVTLLDWNGDLTTLDPTDYRLVAQHGILVRVTDTDWGTCWPAWPKGFANVLVTYTHGYEVIPQGIKAACCQIAARLQSSLLTAGASGPINSETIGSYSYTTASTTGSEGVDVATGMTADEMGQLQPYRQVTLV